MEDPHRVNAYVGENEETLSDASLLEERKDGRDGMTRCSKWRPMRKPLLQTVLDVCGVIALHGGKVEESILFISNTHGTADARRTGR